MTENTNRHVRHWRWWGWHRIHSRIATIGRGHGSIWPPVCRGRCCMLWHKGASMVSPWTSWAVTGMCSMRMWLVPFYLICLKVACHINMTNSALWKTRFVQLYPKLYPKIGLFLASSSVAQKHTIIIFKHKHLE